MIYVNVDVPMYHQYIHFLIKEDKDSIEDCDKFIRKKARCLDPIVTERRGDAFVIPVDYSPGIEIVVMVFFHEDTPYFKSVISHETHHVCLEVFEAVGMNINRETNEAYAYLNGYITRKFYEGLKSELEKRKKKRAKKAV